MQARARERRPVMDEAGSSACWGPCCGSWAQGGRCPEERLGPFGRPNGGRRMAARPSTPRLCSACRSAARERLGERHECPRVAPCAQPARGERSERIEPLSDDVNPVLVGDAQAQVRALGVARLDHARAVVDGQVPGRDVWVCEMPLEGHRVREAVFGVDLAADRVEQEGDGLPVTRRWALPDTDQAALGECPPAP